MIMYIYIYTALMHRTNDLLVLFFLFYYSLCLVFFLLLPFFSLPLSQERKGVKKYYILRLTGDNSEYSWGDRAAMCWLTLLMVLVPTNFGKICLPGRKLIIFFN